LGQGSACFFHNKNLFFKRTWIEICQPPSQKLRTITSAAEFAESNELAEYGNAVGKAAQNWKKLGQTA